LQTLFPDFTIVPLLVGDATPEQVAAVLERLWDGPETRIVISSDLSHYYAAATARRLDDETAAAVVALNPRALRDDAACGREAIAGLLLAARRHAMTAAAVDLRHSGDTGGPADRVVGYGAFTFVEPVQAIL
jgi:AmmeMemoRadiSam system protein B